MQPIDALTLHHFAGELDLKLADGKINKIQQASHQELLLHIWVGGEASRRKLYINIHPDYAFCALLDDTTFLTFPQKPPNFCMVLRKHLTAARIKRVATLPDERVLNLELDNYNELGQQVRLILSLELMGKNSNIILYDPDLNLILGCAHGVSEAMSRKREISIGYPYAPPPRPASPPMRLAAREAIINLIHQAKSSNQAPEEVLTKAYSGVSRATLSDVFNYCSAPDAAYQVIQDLFLGVHLYPAVQRDGSRFSLLPFHQQESDWEAMGSLNGMIQMYFMTRLLENRIGLMRQRLRQVVRTQEKKLLKRQHELKHTDEESILFLKKAGDLLMVAHSQQGSPLTNRIELQDFETGAPVTLELDPQLSFAENAQLYYRRYKKARARQEMAVQQEEDLNRLLQFMQHLYTALDNASTMQELAAVREDLEEQGWLRQESPPKKGGTRPVSKPLTVTSSDGFTIYIGQNGVQNDQIAGKLSRPDDIWLHAHLIPGSHVLVKANKQAVPDQTLLEAASLAAYFSKARGSANVPVVYTKAQYVRKIPNSYPGHVNYTHEQAIHVTPDPARINRLLESRTNVLPV